MALLATVEATFLLLPARVLDSYTLATNVGAVHALLGLDGLVKVLHLHERVLIEVVDVVDAAVAGEGIF